MTVTSLRARRNERTRTAQGRPTRFGLRNLTALVACAPSHALFSGMEHEDRDKHDPPNMTLPVLLAGMLETHRCLARGPPQIALMRGFALSGGGQGVEGYVVSHFAELEARSGWKDKQS